jgi:EAL domain-containing protein (putative c-di-GMP-specific phosphodiesterase class I)
MATTYVQGYLFDRPQSAVNVRHKMENGDYLLSVAHRPEKPAVLKLI